MLRAVFALSFLFGLSPVNIAQNHSERVLITLERTKCFGMCPTYKLSIGGDGSVAYEGNEYVRVTGLEQARIDPLNVQKLLKMFTEIDFFDLKDDYTTEEGKTLSKGYLCSDLPTAIISLTHDGRSKKIENCFIGPKSLERLEGKIDEVTGSKRWVTIDAPTVHEKCKHGWDVRGHDAEMLLVGAAMSGDAAVVRAFIQEGADVNAPGGLEPLQFAWGPNVVKLLVAAGANVNASPVEGLESPLGRAAQTGDADSIEALIKAGAKVNGRSFQGATPLMQAARSCSPGAVKALLNAGANARAKDNDGNGTISYARDGLETMISNEKYPSPFGGIVPDFRKKIEMIEKLLLAAGATSEKPTTK